MRLDNHAQKGTINSNRKRKGNVKAAQNKNKNVRNTVKEGFTCKNVDKHLNGEALLNEVTKTDRVEN